MTRMSSRPSVATRTEVGVNAPPDFDAPDTAYDESGADLTQIDMMLAMTPRERLRFLYETASSLGRLMPDADTD